MSIYTTGRAPAGTASGALAGSWPDNVALGAPLRMGMAWFEDFCADDDTTGGWYGEKRWRLSTLGTGAISTPTPPSTAEHEAGVRLLQATASGDYAVLRFASPFYNQEPPIGTVWECKLRLYAGTTQVEAWAGLQDASYTTAPITGNNTDFIGVRYDAGAAGVNWEAVSRNGTAETVIDTGEAGAVGVDAYLVIGFRRINAGGYEVYQVTRVADERTPPTVTVLGTIDATHPDEPLRPVIGLRSTSGAASILIDYYTLGGRSRR